MRLITEMVGQLDLHRSLDQPLRELAQQAAGAGDLLLGASAGEQLVDQLVGQKRLDLLGELGAGVRTARSASASLRSPYGLAPRHAGAIRQLRGLIQPAWDRRGHESPFDSCLHRRSDTPAKSHEAAVSLGRAYVNVAADEADAVSK